MTPNNNLSVLPFYTSVAEQNARRWWLYGKIFPLYAPQAASFIPFQITRPHTGEALVATNTYYDNIIMSDGSLNNIPSGVAAHTEVKDYSTTSLSSVGFHAIPAATGITDVMAVAFNSQSEVLEVFNPVVDGVYSGQWSLPAGTTTIRVLTYNDIVEETPGYVFGDTMVEVQSVILYNADGVQVRDLDDGGDWAFYYKRVSEDYDVIVSPAFPLAATFPIGQYYLKISDGVNVFYSDIFTVIDDPEDCLLLEWADDEDFVMDAGTIVYTNPAFVNRLYLRAEIAKPDYIFEEEGETRDGYFFPVKQISEKRYRFSFLAPEYLLDVMRFIRMADRLTITSKGKVYRPDTFLITPDWEGNGDVAAVEAVFDAATVAKKLGLGYIKAQRGDFNDDFNNDYNND